MGNKNVNEQITDSVTQSNTLVIGSNPASAMGNLFSAMGQAAANANLNATYAQQQSSVTMQAATTQNVNTLNAIGNAVLTRTVKEIIGKVSK